jgi:regulator of sigma E protease
MGGWKYIVFLLGFGVIIGAHELGHFIAARLCGMEVPLFSIGFGPTILRFSSGGTEFRLGLFPLGGFVKIAGDAVSEEEAVADIEALIEDSTLSEVVRNRLSRSLSEYSNVENRGQPMSWLNWYFFKSGWEQIFVSLSGPFASALLAVPLSMILLFTQGNLVPVVPLSVAQISEASGYFHVGDEVLAINGHAIESVNDYLKASIAIAPGETVDITVRRDQLEQEVSFVAPEDFATTGYGLVFDATHEKVSLPDSILLAIKETISGLSLQLWALWQLLTGNFGLNGALSGPVGIIRFGATSVQDGFVSFVSFCRFLTEGLAIANLFPLPVLDGGRSLISLWRVCTGRSLNAQIQRGMLIGGSIVLLVFAVYVTVLDISRIG